MSSDFPYRTPESEPPPLPPGSLVHRPRTAAVFGVLHLVFAFVGLLSVVAVLLLKARTTVALMAIDRVRWSYDFARLMTVVLAGILIVSGIRLLKGHLSGVRWSNIYAGLSLFLKVLWIGLNIVVVWPARRQVYAHNPGSVGTAVMEGVTLWGEGIGAIYPLLALMLLNRPDIKSRLDPFED